MPYSNATFYLSILLAEIGAVVLVLVLFRFRSELGCCLAKLAGLLVAVLAVISPFRE
jgi:NO-binding membrane sensor protein with MHYT domain